MNGVEIKETLGSGGRVFGCMLSAMGVTRFRSALAGSTMDFVVIDSEHGSRDRKEIQELCTMLRDAGIAPIVRVPIPLSPWVAMALDAGAAGVRPSAPSARGCSAPGVHQDISASTDWVTW